MAGEGALSELFHELVGKAAAVGQVDLVGLKVDVGSERAGVIVRFVTGLPFGRARAPCSGARSNIRTVRGSRPSPPP